jgi:hypothetical protein
LLAENCRVQLDLELPQQKRTGARAVVDRVDQRSLLLERGLNGSSSLPALLNALGDQLSSLPLWFERAELRDEPLNIVSGQSAISLAERKDRLGWLRWPRNVPSSKSPTTERVGGAT